MTKIEKHLSDFSTIATSLFEKHLWLKERYDFFKQFFSPEFLKNATWELWNGVAKAHLMAARNYLITSRSIFISRFIVIKNNLAIFGDVVFVLCCDFSRQTWKGLRQSKRCNYETGFFVMFTTCRRQQKFPKSTIKIFLRFKSSGIGTARKRSTIQRKIMR